MLNSDLFTMPEEWDNMSIVDKVFVKKARLKVIHQKRQEIIDSLQGALLSLDLSTATQTMGTHLKLQFIINKMEQSQKEIRQLIQLKGG